MVKTKRMAQKYIVSDVVMYDNKIMVVKEPRDGSHFDLSCPKEGLVYCFVGVEDIKPVSLTIAILEKNGWELLDCGFYISPNKKGINVYLPDGLIILIIVLIQHIQQYCVVISIQSRIYNIFSSVLVLITKWRCRYG